MASAEGSWTAPELSQFYDSIREQLPILNEHLQSGNSVGDEVWNWVATRVGSKTIDQLKGLYERQSNLLHVPGVTKEIFLASVADLMKVVVVQKSADLTGLPLQQPTTSLTATLLGNAVPPPFTLERGDSGAQEEIKARPKRKAGVLDDDVLLLDELGTKGDSSDADTPPRRSARASKGTTKLTRNQAASAATSGRTKMRRLSDEFPGEEGAEEGVAELLALLVSPGKPAVPAGGLNSSRDTSSARRSDDVNSYEDTGKDDMDVDDDDEESVESDDSFADDPVARRLLERHLLESLRNSKFQLWCMYEWLYPNIDLPWYQTNEFQGCLNALNLTHVHSGTRAQWSHIRSILGRPRRFSPQFLFEQREELAEARARLRAESALPTASGVGGLSPSALSLGINERCIAFHPPSKQILKGVLREKLDNGIFKVAFDAVSPAPSPSAFASLLSSVESVTTSKSPTKRNFKPFEASPSIVPPAQDFISDDMIMSLRYNIATIDRLQKKEATRPKPPTAAQQQQLLFQAMSPLPAANAVQVQAQVSARRGGYTTIVVKEQKRPKAGRRARRDSDDDEEDEESDSIPVRHYQPRRTTRRGKASRVLKSENNEEELVVFLSMSSDEDESSDAPGPPQVMLQAPPTSIYSQEDLLGAARTYTLLTAKEILLQDLKLINEEADRVLAENQSTSVDDVLPDELKRAYAWLTIKLAYVNKTLNSELSTLKERQESLEVANPFLSTHAMTELVAFQKQNLSGGLYSNWYLEMGRACRKQVHQIMDPVLAAKPLAEELPNGEPVDAEAIAAARSIAINAANLIIHVTSCRNLPLSTEQVSLALDAALSQLKPKFARNRERYTQIRELVSSFQTRITQAAMASSPNGR